MSHPFAQTNVGASKQKVHPGSGACQSEKQKLKLARSLCDSGSIADSRAPIIRKSRGKTTTLYKYELSSTKRGIIPWPVKCSSMRRPYRGCNRALSKTQQGSPSHS